MIRHRIKSTLAAALLAIPLLTSGQPVEVNPSQPEQTEDPWKKALPPYTFSFPADHASHPDYKIEWWYYTGNLTADDGRRFGYQLTFFRVGVDREPQNPSRWTVRDLYSAHFALSDIDRGSFSNAEKINRAGIGWAGALTDGYRVWNEDWEAKLDERGTHILTAADDSIGIELELKPGKPPVAHGADGVSQKGSAAGNASHYYSLTRMPTSGFLTVNGERISVSGQSWMDHEFGSSFLEKGQMGWDWMSLQLDDGTDLMLYRFRRNDSTRDTHSNGTIVYSDGRNFAIPFDRFEMEPIETWRSSRSGGEYPVRWRVSVPEREIEIEVRAVISDQEMRTGESTGVTYWEGSVEIDGTQRGRPVRGRGYLEMTGYAGAAMGVLSE